MNTTTNPTATVRPGATLISTTDDRRMRQAIATPQELRPPAGMFVVVDSTGYRTFARLTGRTTRRFGMDCPTVERFDIVTVADGEGALWGDCGEKLVGTYLTRPENVAA